MTRYQLTHHLADAHGVDLHTENHQLLINIHTDDHHADVDVDHTHPAGGDG